MDGIVTASEFNILKQDLHSIHDTITQIFSKVGPLQTKSWKLRDESADLPVEMLSKQCQYYSSDLHSTRASHIMLLELIIDRLALMIQSYMYFTDKLVGKPANRVMDNPPNLGPLCKKYWKRAKLLRQFVNSLQNEINSKNKDLINLGLTLDQAYEENTLLKDMVVKHGLAAGYDTPRRQSSVANRRHPPKTAESVGGWSEFSASLSPKEAEEMADSAVDMVRSSTTSILSHSQVKLPTQITVNNMKTVSKWLINGGQSMDAKTQTIETAFVECNVCCSIQELLEGLGSRLTMIWNMLLQDAKPPKRLIMTPPREAIKWCEYHISVISEVDSQVREVKKESNDTAKVCQLQRDKIGGLESHIANLEAQLKSLQKTHENSRAEAIKREESLKQEISKQAVEYHHNLELRRVEEERLREFVAGLERKVADYQNKYFCEATSKRQYMDELDRAQQEAARAKEMQQTCDELSERIQRLQAEHSSATEQLDNYQCKNDQLIKQNKMLTIKQDQLLAQLEEFDNECEKMRDELDAARDSSTNTTYELSDVVKQKEQLHKENTKLQDAIARIQGDISHLNKCLNNKVKKLDEAHKIIEEEREKETTLIQYPLLVEGERIPKELNRLVQANNIRILRLEEQNRLLRDNALQKELQEAQPNPQQQPKPQPLWTNKCFKELIKSQHIFERVFTPIDYYDGIKSLVDAHQNERPLSCPDTKKRPGGPYTSPHNNPNNTPHQSVSNLHNGWSERQRVHYRCDRCSKTFSSGSDLEIHQIYCDSAECCGQAMLG